MPAAAQPLHLLVPNAVPATPAHGTDDADVRLELEPQDGVVIRSGKRGFAKIKVV